MLRPRLWYYYAVCKNSNHVSRKSQSTLPQTVHALNRSKSRKLAQQNFNALTARTQLLVLTQCLYHIITL